MKIKKTIFFEKMISYYQAPYAQRGHGFGGIFRGLSKLISPIASGFSKVANHPTVRSLAKDAIKTGVNIAANAIEGKNVNSREEGEKLLKRARKKVAKTVRHYADDSENRPLLLEEDDSEDSDNAYDVSETPRYKKKQKLRGKLVKKKKRTIFDE
jgi:hypothetical protein